MAMGKRPAARQGSPLWVTTADLPTDAGHPFFERLNRVLDEAGFDAFVEGLCAVFYASRMGRPSLRPGRYFRMLFIGYFEGLSSERGIAWRVADSLSLRSFLDLDVTDAAPDHSTLSRTRRLIDVETHVAVFTWVLERLFAAGVVRGKTVGVDATTLEANAAMRSIERRDTGESYEAFVQRLAEASGIETPTRADVGALRPVPEGQEDVEQGVAVSPGSGREDHEDEGRSDALSPQGRARGRPGDGRHPLGDRAGCVGGRFGDASGDADDGSRAGRGGAAGRCRGSRRWSPTRATTATRRWWRSTRLGFAVTYRIRSGVVAAGRTRRRGRRRRRSVLRSGRCMGTAVVFAARGAVVYNGGVASWWSGLSRTSMKPEVYDGCGCAAMRMSASGCSSGRPAATSGYCCAA